MTALPRDPVAGYVRLEKTQIRGRRLVFRGAQLIGCVVAEPTCWKAYRRNSSSPHYDAKGSSAAEAAIALARLPS